MDKGRAIQVYIYARKLVQETPNDAELGKIIREHFKTLEKDEISKSN